MELAVLADIHSNYIALERCMEEALNRGIESFLFLGDYVGEMAYPERTMELLYGYERKYDCTFVRGNKENYWLRYRRAGGTGWREYDSTTGALWYAYHHLTERDLDFFESLPIVRRLSYRGLPPIAICHGSPYSEREAMRAGEERTREILAQWDTEVLLCAHTHRQEKLNWQGRIMLNPGSVGNSLGADGKAQFMILHGEAKEEADGFGAPGRRGSWREEFITLDYDREEVIRQLGESGLRQRTPNWCRITEHMLWGGSDEIDHMRVLQWVMELCEEETGACSWPDIPEKYWEMAMQEFFG